jgi:peroxiredoxin
VCACSSSRQFAAPPTVADRTPYNIEEIIEKEKNNAVSLAAVIDNYLENMVAQVPDSIIRAVDVVLAKVEDDTATMNFITRHIFDKYLSLANSKDLQITGIENVIVHIIDNYYLSEKATADDGKFISEIAEYASKNRATLIGKQAKNLKMETLGGVAESLYDIDSPYILLCFYDTSCDHCRHEIPAIYTVFKKFKKKGLAGFCVYTRDDRKAWMEFVSKHKLTDWINAWDPTNENDFRIAYGLYYLPQVYVLDKDKKIVGRALEVASLPKLLNRLIKK